MIEKLEKAEEQRSRRVKGRGGEVASELGIQARRGKAGKSIPARGKPNGVTQAEGIAPRGLTVVPLRERKRAFMMRFDQALSHPLCSFLSTRWLSH